jgi:hypothetical protein
VRGNGIKLGEPSQAYFAIMHPNLKNDRKRFCE